MNADGSSFAKLPDDRMLAINDLCNKFERAYANGEQPRIENYLDGLNEQERLIAVRELVPIEIEYLQETSSPLGWKEYVARFPSLDSEWVSNLLSDDSVVGLKAAKLDRDRDQKHPDRLGDYDILEPIGSGGMGNVYRAVHRRMDRTVALKVLRRELASKVDLQKRFQREVRAAARLVHPNIVTAYDAGEEDGCHYLITEFINGVDLNARVKTAGTMDVTSAVHCVLGAARGLQYAHQQQVIHRDIKPANLLLDENGTVKILDMGLARLDLDGINSETHSELTKSGTFMGTAAFMAPEQARNTRAADARSDVYSLGCVLYFLLAGRPTYSGETVIDTIMAHATEPIPQLMALESREPVSRQLDQIFRRMVAKDPENRFSTMQEVIDALESLAAPSTSESVPAGLRGAVVLDDSHAAMGSLAETIAAGGALSDSIPAGNENGVAFAPVSEADRVRVSSRRPITLLAGVALMGVIAWSVWPLLFGTSEEIRKNGTGTAVNNSALRFNGRSSYVEVESLLHDPDRKLTLEVIARMRGARTSNLITWLGEGWMSVFTNRNRWGVGRLHGGDSLLIESSKLAQTDVWTHLAGTWDGQQCRLFVNGRLANTEPNGHTLGTTEGGFYVGGCDPARLPQHNQLRFFNGDIDVVRVSEGVRYTSNFDAPSALSSDASTIAIFQFNEGEGTETFDSGPGKHRGKIVGAQWVRVTE